ncbi:MAG: response regulator [Candidatus Omnitrophica bacterium]|nr:response regulator [Candidatus Omnitrophota bacterium]
MSHRIRILILEGCPTQARSMIDQLREGGTAFIALRVENESDYRRALREFEPHLVLVDYSRTYHNGFSALSIAREITPGTPLVCVASTINEETAAAALKDGAADCLVKDQLDRLEAIIRNALEISRLRTEARLAKEALQELELRSRDQMKESLSLIRATLDVAVKGILREAAKRKLAEAALLKSERRFRRLAENAGNVISRSQSILIVDADVTKKRLAGAQFLRAQRMESLGRLASGIAHDLNNVLTPISVGLSLIGKQISHDSGHSLLATMQASAARGADIVKQVLTFGRGVEGQKSPIQLNGPINEMARIIRQTFPKSIILKVVLPTDLWYVSVDTTQLHQVLMNLCLNARDAMPKGGTLTLSAANFRLNHQQARIIQGTKTGPYVMFQVADTGSGIPPEHMNKIFEPFFSTKEIQNGSGLGLPTVLGIVHNHDGFIQVESEVGQGSQFKVCLPAVLAMPSSPELPSAPPPQGEGELILVVDDEDDVREVIQKSLCENGYQTVAARNGNEAIAAYSQHHDRIKAVLADLIMPSMDGLSAIRLLREMGPSLHLVAVSGLGSKFDEAKLSGLGVQAFIPKPFTAETLLVTLRKVLHPNDAGSGKRETGNVKSGA